ncbi:serine-threonine protein kinase [Bifidobacterium samirii]|uniref:non-specific serine/threonine protein kinase n=1 Tax=Bifidobacterium samirii TaxID=2306974 RepID=A0A430FV44_9BIFI|nr:serine-threonine protein kinase [Bifidobacterium samirii]
MRLIEGQLIHRRYRLDARLAQGGMGEVWRAWDIQLGRPVAIKALRSDQADVEAKLHRLRAEAHNSANLAHPNIAALFEYYEHDGIGFLIMEYVPSKSLADLYHERGAMDPTELLPILIQTARGLFVAHSHGVIHRDVKPANIMVSDSNEVKITDFGVSYSTNQEQITQDGMVVGTAQYISPEQAQGHQATPQSDIYSLGVVAYEGLCGHRPFTGATPVDIAAAHVNDPVPPLPDTVDLQLSQFVMSMLAKDPLDRPADALVVSRTLARIERRLLDQATAQSDDTTVNPSGRVPRRVRSRPHAVNTLLRAVDPEHLTARRPDRPIRVPTPPVPGAASADAPDVPGAGMPSSDGPTMPPVVTPSIAGTALPDLPSLPDLPASVSATIGEVTLAAGDTTTAAAGLADAPSGIATAIPLDHQHTAASHADLRNLWKEQQ